MKQTVIFNFCMLIIVVSNGQAAKDYTQKGRDSYESREFMESLLNLNKAIEIDPNYAQACYVRANIKDTFDDRHGAMKDYNIAVEKNPKFAEAFYSRGNVKMKLQDTTAPSMIILLRFVSMKIILRHTSTAERPSNFFRPMRMPLTIVQRSFNYTPKT